MPLTSGLEKRQYVMTSEAINFNYVTTFDNKAERKQVFKTSTVFCQRLFSYLL